MFDPMMDFSVGYFSKTRILKLSEDLVHVDVHLVREGHSADHTDHPAYVLLLSAMNLITVDESGNLDEP